MAIKELIIRVGAQDTGVRAVIARINDGLRDEMRKMRVEAEKPVAGPAVKPRFDFKEQLIRQEMARVIRQMEAEAKRHKIQIEAQMVVKEARDRLFGRDSPAIDPKLGRLRFQDEPDIGFAPPKRIVNRGQFEQDVRDAEAARLRQIREDTRRARVDEAVNRRLFGAEPKAPLRTVDRSAFEQQVRDEVAIRKRAEREASQRARVEAEANMRLHGAVGENIFPQPREAAEAGKKAGIEWGRSFKLLVGGGEAAIASLIGNRIRNVTEEAIKLRDAFRAGKISMGELVEESAKLTPILGSWIAAGRNIRELLSGEAAEAARITAEAESTNRFLDARKKILDEIKRIQADGANARDEIDRRRRREGAPSDAARAEIDAAEEFRQRVETESKRAQDAKAGLIDPAKSQVAKDLAERRAALLNLKIPDAVESRFVAGLGGTSEYVPGNTIERDKALADQKKLNREIRDLEKQQSIALEAIRVERGKVLSRLEKEFHEGETHRAREAAKEQRKRFGEAIASFRELSTDLAGKVRERFNDDIEANQGRDRTLRQSRIAALETEGELGSRAAKLEAERLRIAESYNDRKRELFKILREETATTEQRRRAQEELNRLPELERRAKERVGRDVGPRQFAEVVDTRSLTGAGAAARENRSDPLLDETKRQTESVKQTNAIGNNQLTKLDKIIDLLLKGRVVIRGVLQP